MQALTSLISYVMLAITPALAQATTPTGNRRRHSMVMDHLGHHRDWWRDLVVHAA
jgi:hypothetical protein